MKLTSRHRRIAQLLLATLLFMQCALAAHACQMAMHGTEPADTGAAPADCERMRAAQLCKAHCDQGLQSVGGKLQIDAGSVFATGAALVSWPVTAVPAAPALSARAAVEPGPPPGTPPLYLAFQVFRN